MKSITTLFFAVFALIVGAQNALDFDGIDDNVQTTAPSITGTNARTVEAWIKTSTNYNPSTGGTQGVIVDMGSMTNGQRFTVNLLWSNSLRVEIGGNGISGSTAINDGNWHHIAVVYDPTLSTKVYLYIDGSLETSGNFSAVTMNTSTSTIRIGRRVDNNNYFDGSIDEVRIWNIARSASDILGAMNSEFCTAPTGLVAYYKANQGTAGGTNTGMTTLDDNVGTNDGTLANFSLSGSSSNWVTGKSLAAGGTADSVAITSCGPYTAPSGNNTWATSGNYIDTAMSSTGCDSILFIDLTVKANSAGSFTATGCNTYVSPSGKYTWTTAGTYHDTIPNAIGCDSVLTINLTINTVDTNVLVSGASLTSWETGANYQWLDCNNGHAAISGATGQTFNPTVSGSYAVEVSKNNCVDTSACYVLTGIGIAENETEGFSIYPNPVNSSFSVEFNQFQKDVLLEIIDATGSVVLRKENLSGSILTVNVDFPAGIYFVKIKSGEQTLVKRISVQ